MSTRRPVSLLRYSQILFRHLVTISPTHCSLTNPVFAVTNSDMLRAEEAAFAAGWYTPLSSQGDQGHIPERRGGGGHAIGGLARSYLVSHGDCETQIGHHL